VSDLPVIEAIDLGKTFGRVQAVRGLSLAVERGEIFGLIGPDGAGKTTVIRMLAAIIAPGTGSVRVLGYATDHQADRLRHAVGYMPQRFSLYADLTVAENLGFFADVFGVRGPERRRRVEELLDFARLADFTRRRAAHLSGGMQKKLALACTLIHAPQVIFLDEPTTGVDPISRREFWDILASLHVKGVTLFVSTPYMDEAERCSRVGLIYEGQIIRCDTPDTLREGVEGELLAIWTGELARARLIVEQMPEVLDVQVYGDLLHVFVNDADQMSSEITQRLAHMGVPVTKIAQTTPRVEEAFVSLIRQLRKAQP
jgi:ABC-2 type transport system ATP-binding protein